MKILVVGDLHGNGAYFKHVLKAANIRGCDVILQCGDFGFWPHKHPEYEPAITKLLEEADEERAKLGMGPLWLLWVDGNHENFDWLYAKEWPKTERGFWKITERICYAPRAHRWEWDGVSFLALGGGNSIDKAHRTEFISWWRQELITFSDVKKAIEGGLVDVMICHDMPAGVENGPELWFKDQAEDENNRKSVRAVMDAVKPKILYHGHYHYRYDSNLNGTKIVGLACDGAFEKNWTMLDTKEVTDAKPLPDNDSSG